MKVGIVCDNYKVNKFMELLDGYVKLNKPFSGKETSIFVYCEQHQIEKISNICKEVEGFYREIKSKKN